jgi:2-iminobutanoate/2-iminopropanoate deaminase
VREAVAPASGPAAVGPYSPAIRAGNLLFVSCQIPLHPQTGEIVAGDITEQTHQVMRNMEAVLRAAGAAFDHVVRTTVFLSDLNDFGAMNAVYAQYVGSPPPARATVQVARLPRDVRVEIDAIAVLEGTEGTEGTGSHRATEERSRTED